jgi:hypothetical protein
MDDTDESPIVAILTKLRRSFDGARKFWRTKRAIESGVALYDWPQSQLNEAGYYGPWTFNILQTSFAGGIAGLVVGVIAFLRGENDAEPAIDMYNSGKELTALLISTMKWVEPFFVPILTTSVVFVIAWGSLRESDSSVARRQRARRTYLYFDAAFGFWSQALVAFFLATFSAAGGVEGVDRNGTPGLVLLFALLAVCFRQGYITLRKIPRRLFEVNGYSSRIRRIWQGRRENDAPWNKLGFAYLVAAYPLKLAVVGVQIGAAFVIAYLLLGIRHAVGAH